MLCINSHRDEQIKLINFEKNLDTEIHIYEKKKKVRGNIAKDALNILVFTSGSQLNSP